MREAGLAGDDAGSPVGRTVTEMNIGPGILDAFPVIQVAGIERRKGAGVTPVPFRSIRTGANSLLVHR